MKICLISPPYNLTVKSVVGISYLPLGLSYLASVLRQNHEMKIIDTSILDYTTADVRRIEQQFMITHQKTTFCSPRNGLNTQRWSQS